MERYQRDIGKIYIVVVLSCLLLTASFYMFGFRPLSERLRSEQSHEITHFLDSGLWLLQGVLDKHHDLARQSASRTAIRNKQIAYLKGDVSKEELVAFSAPKLADAMEANREIVGISRFDPHGDLLFAVGVPLPDGAVTACDLGQLRKIRVLGPRQLAGESRMLYCSPIVDRKAGHVGADILIVDDAGIERVIDVPQQNLGNLGIVCDNKIIYWPRELDDSAARGALEARIESGVTDDDYILESRVLAGDDWQLFAVVNKERFFAGVNRQLLILFTVVLAVTFFVLVLTVFALRPVIRALLREKQLFELSHRDGLTGLYNHAYMQKLLERELARAQRFERPLSVLMFDIDHFKQVNDSYGHQAGDAVLKRIGEVVLREVRRIDLAVRYGGEEFLVILPETGSDGAVVLAERLRLAVAREKVLAAAGDISVTISIGVVTCEDCYDKHKVVAAADKALYASKDGGRNQVTAVALCAAV
ncbi:MAG: GGDEF domain-containing protein [Granulosicoccaceae bacterium]|jgi:diguanylate cyclase (GGDEF)-like protein